ncbi:hypothetical protein XELAEV_18033013mg [Xenopus laevis]|uniref:Uncharacterized protein n=1 Tax=Xenopus laevis TaxID=8355 RepID=A0A974CIL0_XENLA|nr:hypothetical protein XELAEV_18033013mg [Xenopus laevis]
MDMPSEMHISMKGTSNFNSIELHLKGKWKKKQLEIFHIFSSFNAMRLSPYCIDHSSKLENDAIYKILFPQTPYGVRPMPFTRTKC